MQSYKKIFVEKKTPNGDPRKTTDAFCYRPIFKNVSPF